MKFSLLGITFNIWDSILLFLQGWPMNYRIISYSPLYTRYRVHTVPLLSDFVPKNGRDLVDFSEHHWLTTKLVFPSYCRSLCRIQRLQQTCSGMKSPSIWGCLYSKAPFPLSVSQRIKVRVRARPRLGIHYAHLSESVTAQWHLDLGLLGKEHGFRWSQNRPPKPSEAVREGSPLSLLRWPLFLAQCHLH